MKIDKQANKEKVKRQNGLTTNRTSRPDKVLFFPNPHFLFLQSTAQMAHCLSPNTQANPSQKPKSHFPIRTKGVNLLIQTLKLNSYGNN